MPEFIVEPVYGRFAISVSPKVACASIRFWMWQIAHGSSYSGDNIFIAFQPHLVKMGQSLPDSVELAVAIHRDGVSRMRAVYDHRIRREREAPDEGLDHFARHLPDYCALYPQIDHHCEAQSVRLGSDMDAFSDVIPISRLDRLRDLVGQVIGRETPELPRVHTNIPKTPLTKEATMWFEHWTAHDTALGWDGETFRLFESEAAEP